MNTHRVVVALALVLLLAGHASGADDPILMTLDDLSDGRWDGGERPLPAVNARGTALAFISGGNHGMSDHTTHYLEVRRVGDHALLYKQLIGSTLEIGDDDAAKAKLVVERRKRVERLAAYLTQHGPWRPVRELVTGDADEGELAPPLVSPDGSIAVRYGGGGRLELDLASERKLFVRWHRLDIADAEDDGIDCDISAVLSAMAIDDLTRTLVLTFRYDVSGVSDQCGMPPSVTRAFPVPSRSNAKRWRPISRQRAPRWLDYAWENTHGSQQPWKRDAYEREQVAIFFSRWGERYPRSPVVLKAKEILGDAGGPLVENVGSKSPSPTADMLAQEPDGVPSNCARWTRFVRACIAGQPADLRSEFERTLGAFEIQWKEEAVSDTAISGLNQTCLEAWEGDKVSMAGLCPELARRPR